MLLKEKFSKLNCEERKKVSVIQTSLLFTCVFYMIELLIIRMNSANEKVTWMMLFANAFNANMIAR